MKTARLKIASNIAWSITKALNLVGAIGRKIAVEVTNRPKHNIQIINTGTGEVMHEANNISTAELNRVLDAMRTLKGSVQTIVKTVK